jgi:hypothetical protein
MRIDLFVPFSQKDLAKSKGAQWDVARKTWYVIDPLDVRSFAIWMGQDVKDWYNGKRPKSGKQKRPKNKSKGNLTHKTTNATLPMPDKVYKAKKPAITGPSVFIPLCECDALPWDDCEHTDRMAHNAMKEMLA